MGRAPSCERCSPTSCCPPRAFTRPSSARSPSSSWRSLIVEPEAAALAAARASTQDVERLRRDVEGLRRLGSLDTRPPEDLGFHLDLVRGAHNGALLRISTAIIAFYDHDQALPTERDYNEHRAVLQAIERRDGDGARRAMRAHLEAEVEARLGDAGRSARKKAQ